MGASGKQVGGGGVHNGVTPLLQQRYIPGQGGRLSGWFEKWFGGNDEEPVETEPVETEAVEEETKKPLSFGWIFKWF